MLAALLAQAVSIFDGLSAKALAPGLAAKPPVLVMAKAGKWLSGLVANITHSIVIHGEPQSRGCPVQMVSGLVRFALWFLSPSVEVVQAVRERAFRVGCRGRPWW